MRKSAFTTVFLIAILLTGAIATASVSMIDTEASSDKKDKKKDKDRDHERDYDKKDHERDYDKKDKERDHDDDKRYYDDYRDYEDDKSDRHDDDDKKYKESYYEKDNYYKKDPSKYDDDRKYKESYYEKDNYYKKDPSKYDDDDDDDKHPKQLYKAYPKKQYSESFDVKSHKKVKIIDCRNLNVNGDELDDLREIEPVIKRAIASSNVKEGKQSESFEYSENSPNTRIFYVEPDVKVIFRCINENHNLLNDEKPVETDSTVEGNTVAAAAENNNTSVINNSTESVETSQSGNVTSGTIQSSPSMPSSGISTSQTSEVPFIFPIPKTVS